MTPDASPLSGARVVVTRPRPQAGELVRMLETAGAQVICLPVIEILDPPSWDDLDRAVAELARGSYDWVVFTSVNAVERTFRRMEAAGLEPAVLSRAGVAAVGTSTARSLRERGLRADVVPEVHTAEAVAVALGRGKGRVLLPRVQDAPRGMTEALESSGWTTVEVTAYVNVPARPDSVEARLVTAREFDVVTFTSASTVRAFAAAFGDPRRLALDDGNPAAGLVACIGPQTAAAAHAAGFRIDVVAADHTARGLVGALVARRRSSGEG